MKQYPTLYSRTSTGAIQEWFMEQDGCRYRSTSGQKDGAKTTTEWTVAKAKNVGRANETTAEQQATFEVESKYTKKKKEGYAEDINGIDQTLYIEPMLAKSFKDRKEKVVYPVFVDRKYNGMRQITTKRGAHTRKGEAILSAPHIFENLKGLFVQYPDLVLDGELYCTDYASSLNKLIHLVRRTKNITKEHLQESAQLVKYFVYDAYGFNGITQTTKYSERKKAFSQLLAGFPSVVVVDNVLANNEEEVMAAYHRYLSEGYEGAIVRIDGAYENKRSSNLLKMKETMDDEFEVVDVEEGDGNRSGMAGRVILKMKDGKQFAANLKGTEAQFRDTLVNKDRLIGKRVTIYYNDFTGLGTPNYAQYQCDNSDKGDR